MKYAAKYIGAILDGALVGVLIHSQMYACAAGYALFRVLEGIRELSD